MHAKNLQSSSIAFLPTSSTRLEIKKELKVFQRHKYMGSSDSNRVKGELVEVEF